MINTHKILAVSAFAVMPLMMQAAIPVYAQSAMGQADRSAIDKIIAEWPNRPKLGAEQMLVKYGLPQEATSEQLIWHNQGPYKRITVTKSEDNHDFPKPHMDYMEHTINYVVPADKADTLSTYDGSLTFDRTRGEMSARCDLEGHNILTLNLAHDIVTGKKSADEARKAFGDAVVADTQGKYPPYTTALQFEPKKTGTSFADVPVIPGSPKRPVDAAKVQGDKDDGEVLGFVGAVDDNEIVAALVAGTKKLSPEVASYAKMMHTEHGKNLEETLKLGQQIKVTPMETAEVDKLRVKGAGELAALVPLDGEAFGKAYLEAMIKSHGEVLEMIDNQLLKNADNAALKKHLTETRTDVAKHLDEAKRVQASLK